MTIDLKTSLELERCAICGGRNVSFEHTSRLTGFAATCARCGSFSMTDGADIEWNNFPEPTLRQRANASGWVRENQNALIYKDNLSSLRALRSPTKNDRAMKILRMIDRETEECGAALQINPFSDQRWVSISWSTGPEETTWLLENLLRPRDLLDCPGMTHYCVTPRGYELLSSAEPTGPESKIGFCAMWFHKSMEPLWLYAIAPAIGQAGFEPLRIDRLEHNNKIDDEIVAAVRKSRFVVADMTGGRGGVYFEAGLAQGLNIEVIWTVREDKLKRVHFDTRQYNFIDWSADDLAKFRKRLVHRIEATVGHGPVAEYFGV